MEFPFTLNIDFLDSQYRLWKADPASVSEQWRLFFQGFDLAFDAGREAGFCEMDQVLRQSRVDELIYRYRDLGHLLACLDPLASCPVDHPLLRLDAFHLTEDDLDRSFFVPNFAGKEQLTLRETIGILSETYCRSVGVEYMHLQDPDERQWLQDRMEPQRNRANLSSNEQIRMLNKLCQATLFEQFLNTKYLGQKRFSIEGAETIIAMLDVLLRTAAENEFREVILGMSHRGRLNVQVNTLGKPFEAVFCEFEDNYNPESLVGSGDVKYHQGFLADLPIGPKRNLRVLLASNPSHLESVDPVVEGIARGRQDLLGDRNGRLVLPLLLHGDASFSGEGVVYETLNLSQLEGYKTGGTIHIIINNQIGFTTLPENARSTRYSTDVAKMLMIPIFHVHGEDPEAAVHVVKLAFDYRQRFSKDVVIDVVCYRRYGHNEGDEPYFTQPRMYERIRNRPPIYQLYAEKLFAQNVVEKDHLEKIREEMDQTLERAFQAARERTCKAPESRFYENWEGIAKEYSFDIVETGVPEQKLLLLARRMHHLPDGFKVYSKLERILKRRLDSIEKGEAIDWATAEHLAFATLLVEGFPVRLSGQDSRRGTFSQRHSVLIDEKSGESFIPLNALDDAQAPFFVYDSMLAEYAVLGFEYGYSLVDPGALVIWEAQFGDFANNAQAIIDQYIVSAESKWRRLSGLVLLLPHGFEGQGPEHSSARLERFLQLCAENNMEVCYPTTPAQYFHLLRRQMKRNFRKPLIVMAPKSLLRHPKAVSKLSEMSSGHFRFVLEDKTVAEKCRRVIFCTGKIFYELMQRREDLGVEDLALVRLEQLYPFPSNDLMSVVDKHRHVEKWFWVQEEPENMGAWGFVFPYLRDVLKEDLGYIGRKASASPATGYHLIHKIEQQAIIDEAVTGGNKP